jgi:hypothetical protein
MTKEILDISEFFFETPLYEKVNFPIEKDLIYRLFSAAMASFDGHCPKCSKESTFRLVYSSLPSKSTEGYIRTYVANHLKRPNDYSVRAACARDARHDIRCIFDLHGAKDGMLSVVKIGMFPSLADIANDETKKYRKILSDEDGDEFHKAIGLAAHGVGVGSFVYLRRIFERLVYARFDEFKDSEGWNEENFNKARMNDKLGMLKSHIPDFLYDNREIYGVLSQGIHSLSESECLELFSVLKNSIVIILEDDLTKKQELETRAMAAKSLKAFSARRA